MGANVTVIKKGAHIMKHIINKLIYLLERLGIVEIWYEYID